MHELKLFSTRIVDILSIPKRVTICLESLGIFLHD